MVIAINPGEERQWVHPTDREKPEEEQTRFFYRVLSRRQMDWCEAALKVSGLGGGAELSPDVASLALFRRRAVLAGLVNVTGLRVRGRDGTLRDVPFETVRAKVADQDCDAVTERFLDHLPDEVIDGLGRAILKSRELEVADRKN